MELGNLEGFTAEKIDLFCDRLKKLKQEACQLGFQEFEKIELCKFLEPALSEYI